MLYGLVMAMDAWAGTAAAAAIPASAGSHCWGGLLSTTSSTRILLASWMWHQHEAAMLPLPGVQRCAKCAACGSSKRASALGVHMHAGSTTTHTTLGCSDEILSSCVSMNYCPLLGRVPPLTSMVVYAGKLYVKAYIQIKQKKLGESCCEPSGPGYSMLTANAFLT